MKKELTLKDVITSIDEVKISVSASINEVKASTKTSIDEVKSSIKTSIDEVKASVSDSIDELAIMVKEGFDATATKQDLQATRTEMLTGFKRMDQRFDGLEEKQRKSDKEMEICRQHRALTDARLATLEAAP